MFSVVMTFPDWLFHTYWLKWMKNCRAQKELKNYSPLCRLFYCQGGVLEWGPGCGTVSLDRDKPVAGILLTLWLLYHQGQVFSHCWGTHILYYGDYLLSATPVRTSPELSDFWYSYKSSHVAGFDLTVPKFVTNISCPWWFPTCASPDCSLE